MSGIRWTQEEYEQWQRQNNPRDNRVAVQAANVERNARHAATQTDAGQKVDSRVRIHFHSKRRRAIDPDGLYAKAAIDGLRQGGLLVDDSAKYVEAVSYSQESSDSDETIITIEVLNR